ncbi:MAG: GDP-mannose 4,6-dehydratase [Spirochaetaceae bacterium]|nr:GDP-mannose 4,6-dehydratase [Spirochaetaceae bacterium]
MKKALITGINGQDGSYLAELLLSKGYEIYGVVRRESIENSKKMENIAHLLNQIKIVTCQLENSLAVYKLFNEIKPDECYHLAASSFVSFAVEDDLSIMMNNFTTTHNILLSVLELCPACHIYFAGSSEIFGNATEYPQSEKTPYNPRSVYGISKLSSHSLIKNYRERFNLFACTGFTYNHESPRRGRTFVTRKVTSSVADIVHGKQDFIELGNIQAKRDWGYAPEYVQAMYLMLQNKTPKDYVISTGILHTVEDLLKIAFDTVDLDYHKYLRINESFIRPGEKIPLVGDSSLIYKDLGWKAKKPFNEIIEEMVRSDLK